MGASPDGINFDKKFKKLLIRDQNLLTVREIYSLKVLLLTFYIPLNKDKKPYLKKEHYFGYYTQIQGAMGMTGLKCCHCVVYIYIKMIIVKVVVGKDYFKSAIDYYINELLSRANSE